MRFWFREHRGGPRRKALHPGRLRAAVGRLPGLWNRPRRGFGSVALRPRAWWRPVPGVPHGDRRRVPARLRHAGKPENPCRNPHPSGARTNRSETERPQGGPLPRPGPRSREYTGRPPTSRCRTQDVKSPGSRVGVGQDPSAWAVEHSAGRPRPEPPDGVRNDFQRDRDRIIHAKAFRRLMHKTQVFISPDGDHYRTRLTHTLEMMQISRTIARSLGLNEDLTEAISLGHDLGHTPFGHTGEEALSRALSIHGRTFRHNEHSLRVVDHLESGGNGLNLTLEVRDGIRNHTGEVHPSTREGEIVRIADRIAYVNHDVDDALRAGIISRMDLPRHPISMLGEQMSARIDTLVRDMIHNSREKGEVSLSDEVYQSLMELRGWLFRNVYEKPGSRENRKAAGVVTKLFEYYLEHPEEWTASDPDPITETIDFVAGMTDRYALATYRRLFLPRGEIFA